MLYRRPLTRWARGAAAACVLTILAAAGAAADSTDRHASSEQNNFSFVDSATVPGAQLRELSDPIPFSTYLRSQGKSAVSTPRHASEQSSADEPDLRAECATHETEAKTAKGWIKNRFESCQKRPYDLVLRNTQGTETLGRLWFDVWTLGFSYDGSRKVDYAVSVENIRVQPVQNEDATKWRIGQHFRHSINASASDANPQVTAPAVVERDELLGVWDPNPLWTLSYTSPDNGPQHSTGNLQRVFSLISMDLTADSPNANPYSQVDTYHSNVRFDYAGPQAGKHKGTVFTQARVELVMSQKDPEVNESALHIYDAQKRPERTFPSFLGKSVPGEKEPLHRLVNKDKQEANRAKSISECKKVWGDYSGTGLECDEYPFASTKEGSTKGDDRYSVRLIDGTDNGNGGNRLNQMYTLNRMLDDDPFYVKITA